MVFWQKLTKRLKYITNNKEHAESMTNTLTTKDPKKKTRQKATRGIRSIRVDSSNVFNSPGEQEETSAVSCEGLSQAENVPGTHVISCYA